MGSRPERGAYGNARGVPDKQRRNRRLRDADPRHIAAAEQVRRNQEIIDRLSKQSADDAAASAIARSKVTLEYTKPEVIVPEPTPVSPTTPRTSAGGSRFVLCHCGHDKAAHTNPKAMPACVMCDCPGYRPVTAPDPLDEKNAPAVSKIGLLLQAGKNSEYKRTVALATKIEGLLVTLSASVEAETEAREEREAELARTREARQRVARLEAELREAREALGSNTKRKPRTVMAGPVATPSRTATEYARTPDGGYICPECGDTKGSPQGIGAHRARKHGYRKDAS